MESEEAARSKRVKRHGYSLAAQRRRFSLTKLKRLFYGFEE